MRNFAFFPQGDGCVVGASALVTKPVPAGATVVGVNKIIQKTDKAKEARWADVQES